MDKIQSLYQGRQVTIKPSDIFVPMKFLDTFEEYEDWAPFAFSNQTTSAHPGCPSYSVSTFRCLCQLSIVLSDILSSIYDERSFEKDPEELSSILETLHSKLTAWQKALPKHLAVNLKKAPTALPPHGMSLQSVLSQRMQYRDRLLTRSKCNVQRNHDSFASAICCRRPLVQHFSGHIHQLVSIMCNRCI